MSITKQFFPNASDDRLTDLAGLLNEAYGHLIAQGLATPPALRDIMTNVHAYPETEDELSRIALLAIGHLLSSDRRIMSILPQKTVSAVRCLIVDCM